MSDNLTPTTRIVTPTDRAGVILDPPWDMPVHHLVLFDDGCKWWMLRSVLRVEEVRVKQARKAKAPPTLSS